MLSRCLDHAAQADVSEAVRIDRLPNFFQRQLIGDELVTGGEVNSKKHGHCTGGDEILTCTSAAPGLAQHPDEGTLGIATHDGIVDDDEALPGNHFLQWVELEVDTSLPGELWAE